MNYSVHRSSINIVVAGLLIFLFSSLGCDLVEKVRYDHVKMNQCHNAQTWDSTKIKKELTGKWTWEYYSCLLTPDDIKNKKYQGLSIQFNPDNTLDVFQDNQLVESSGWLIDTSYSVGFHIKTDSFITQTRGRIYFCGNSLAFIDSYRDACDNYFYRE